MPRCARTVTGAEGRQPLVPGDVLGGWPAHARLLRDRTPAAVAPRGSPGSPGRPKGTERGALFPRLDAELPDGPRPHGGGPGLQDVTPAGRGRRGRALDAAACPVPNRRPSAIRRGAHGRGANMRDGAVPDVPGIVRRPPGSPTGPLRGDEGMDSKTASE